MTSLNPQSHDWWERRYSALEPMGHHELSDRQPNITSRTASTGSTPTRSHPSRSAKQPKLQQAWSMKVRSHRLRETQRDNQGQGCDS
ncbi:hypothetical protein LY76DRAFT_301055 [Colletotrichum caudatum]|nr:hypothetical protein LY76DRAFT_301055 [Colletotrichum caudatum]